MVDTLLGVNNQRTSTTGNKNTNNNTLTFTKMEGKEQDKLCFIRQGENGMEIQIVGNANTLMSMLHAALMSHAELRKIMMPVFQGLMKDDKFFEVVMHDAFSAIEGKSDEEDIIDNE